MATAVLPAQEEVPGLLPGPGSITWRRAGDLRLSHTSGYALLLQVAHPTVGAGVAEHSDFQKDPWGRLFRTLDYVNGTIYGGPQLAADIGRRVRDMHKTIKGVRPDGERYHALEPTAYTWVHATLASSIVKGHSIFGTPLSPAEREQLWAEWKRLGRLIGVRERDLPDTWADFIPYFDDMVHEVLEDTEMVHVVLDTLSRPAVPPPGVSREVWKVAGSLAGRGAWLTTVGMLPRVLRVRFGLDWTRRDELELRALAAASRASTRALPRRVREFGPLYVKWRTKQLERGDVARRTAAAH